MRINRRQFIRAGSLASIVTASPFSTSQAATNRIKAVAFDAFPIFDPRPIFDLTETLFPGGGQTLNRDWRTRQFEYQWLRALAGRCGRPKKLRNTNLKLVFLSNMTEEQLGTKADRVSHDLSGLIDFAMPSQPA